jgi:GINS complex subunit 4
MDNNSTLNSSIHITQASDALYETGLDDEFVTDDVAEMTQIWINERNSPEVLPYRRRLVEDLTELIEHQVSKRKKKNRANAHKARLFNPHWF